MNQSEIRVIWFAPRSYDDAKDLYHCVYIHERDGRIFYVGLANSWFGGNRRRRPDGETSSPRYQSGYRHWIDALLITGSRLFIGRIEDTGKVEEVEKHLRWQLGPELDRRPDTQRESRNRIIHSGDVPRFLSSDDQA